MKIKAFTLSEVLITLVIIGIIAAITVPNITANYRRSEISGRLKKCYSMLLNASMRAKADGKDWKYWAESTDNSSSTGSDYVLEYANEYLLPYINHYEDKLTKTSNDINIYLNDGMIINLSKNSSSLRFKVDVNGKRKPNKSGSDIFYFQYRSEADYSVYSGGSDMLNLVGNNIYYNTREKALNACKLWSDHCSFLLFMDGWEFKDDYPYSI